VGGSRPAPGAACGMAKPTMLSAGCVTMIPEVKSHSVLLDGMCECLEVALEANSHTVWEIQLWKDES
jgi:hypothetical protein